ncbi:MAG: transglycosylase domain-containing protein, partial [Gammaproteobacteria bacterium]
MNFLARFLKTGIVFALILFTVSAIALAGLYVYLNPQLPSIEGLSDVRLQVPLRIYSSDGSLLGEFGEKRRSPKALEEIPPRLRQAFLSAEDDRFFEHPGVDYQGILRAAFNLISTGERGQGGSTITMQLARNFYLSSEKTYIRKLSEIFLALKIERELSKEKILELYLNKIYLGNRSYGVAAAAQVYYGMTLEELTLPQIAMIAGLPKAPSRYNPVVNPERAVTRRDYVLSRMNELGYISDDEYVIARETPVSAELHRGSVQVSAPYINEMVRVEIVDQFGDEAYTRGLRVYTTVQDRLQEAANESLWNGLVAYDRRHGYRGVIRHVEILADEPLDDLHLNIKDDRNYGMFEPAIVAAIETVTLPAAEQVAQQAATEKADEQQAEVSEQQAIIVLRNGDKAVLKRSGLGWAKPYISVNRTGKAPESVDEVLKPGDVIW